MKNIKPVKNIQSLGMAGSGSIGWGETPGEPWLRRNPRFSAREDARPTNRLIKLTHCRMATALLALSGTANESPKG
jgi:hypothetical protein